MTRLIVMSLMILFLATCAVFVSRRTPGRVWNVVWLAFGAILAAVAYLLRGGQLQL